MAETGKIEIGTSTLNITPTFSNATKTSMVEIPTIIISLSQVISQDPLEVQCTSEQAAIMENDDYDFVKFDVNALGLGVITMSKSYETGDDVYCGTATTPIWVSGDPSEITGTRIYRYTYNKADKTLTVNDIDL